MKNPNGNNCLAFVNPQLSREWDYEKNYPLIPEGVFPNTHKVVFWICPCGNSWEAQIQRRNLGYCKCKKCNKVKEHSNDKDPKHNCLSFANPQLAKEWDYEKNYPLTPENVLCRGRKKFWWKCNKCGHEWKNRIDHRNSGYGNCIKCNSLATKRPDLLKEWDYNKNNEIDPFFINCHSVKIVNWKCQNGHEWRSNIDNRTRKDFTPGCPYCSNPPKRVCIDNCLATKNPQLATEWHPTKNGNLTPYNVTSSSSTKVWWICKKGHEWHARINNRDNGNGCPDCYGLILKDGTKWASIPEAYIYLKYKEKRYNMICHGSYGKGLGSCKYDIYLPDQNKYIEITSFPKTVKNTTSYLNKIIKDYYDNIAKKKKYVENILMAEFEFICFQPTKKQKEFVQQNCK